MNNTKTTDIIDNIEFWLVAGGVLLTFVRISLLLPVVIIGGVLFVFRLTRSGLKRSPIDLAVLFLLAFSTFSMLISALPEITNPQVYRIFTGILLYYAIYHWVNSEIRIKLFSWGFNIAGIGLFVFSFFSVEWSQSKLSFVPQTLYNRFSVLVQDTVNPNVLAGSLIVFALFFVRGVLWSNIRQERLSWLLHIAGSGLLAGVLVLSQSRSALLAFGFGVILLAIMRWRRAWVLLIFLALGAVWGANYFGTNELLDVLFSGQQFKGFASREDIWSRGIFILKDFSFTGIGVGLFWEVVSRIYPLGPVGSPAIPHVHNLFLQVGIDLGFFGLIAWLSIYFTGLLVSWKVFAFSKLRSLHWLEGIGAGLFVIQIAIGVHGIFDAVIWGMVRAAPLLWAVWGFAMASWYYANHQSKDAVV